MFTYTNIMSARRCYRTKPLYLIIYRADLSSFIHYPSPLAIPHLYPHTLTPTLTTKTPINRAFQTSCEGVRVEKENFFLLYCNLNGEFRHHRPWDILSLQETTPNSMPRPSLHIIFYWFILLTLPLCQLRVQNYYIMTTNHTKVFRFD